LRIFKLIVYYVLLDGDETEIGENGINLSGKKIIQNSKSGHKREETRGLVVR
jgi:hypothetical protein